MKFSIIFSITVLASIYGCSPDTVAPPIEVKNTDYTACLIDTEQTSLEVMTWNLKFFPATATSIAEIKNVIARLNPDVIALQEINSTADFETLINDLEGWEGVLSNSGNLNLAYLFKISEIDVLEGITAPFKTNSSTFPRPPAVIKLRHEQGDIYFINLHLKCCGGTENIERRMEAARLIKDYIDKKLADEKVIVLGDYNDEIYSEDGSETTFDIFKEDPDKYLFVDMEIAKDKSMGWSYPSWPSHIDHILLTNEFFGKNITTTTLKLEGCNSFYPSQVSDHRPLITIIK